MADFVNGFWAWYVAALAIGGLVFCLWLVWWMASGFPRSTKVEPMGHVWDEDLQELNNPLPKWWLYLFYILLAFAVYYFVMYPGLGTYRGVLDWGSKDQYETEVALAQERYAPRFDPFLEQSVEELASNPEALEVGGRLFQTYCAVCHGSDARGARGFPNLADADWLYGGAPEAIKVSIMEGRQGNMPAWEEGLGRQGVFQVTEYVRSLSGREINPTAALAGKNIYAASCAACHGADGTGNQALGAPNLTDNIWLYGGSQKAIMETISRGRQGLMPAHKDFPGEAKAHLLAGYVFSLSREGGERPSAATVTAVAAEGQGEVDDHL